jgi:hypothetical protein
MPDPSTSIQPRNHREHGEIVVSLHHLYRYPLRSLYASAALTSAALLGVYEGAVAGPLVRKLKLLRGLQVEERDRDGQVPGRRVVRILVIRPVGPVGGVHTQAVEPLGDRNLGQLGEPDGHGLVEEVLHLDEVVDGRAAHFRHNLVVLRVTPPRPVVVGDTLAGRADVLGDVEVQRGERIHHAAAVTTDRTSWRDHHPSDPRHRAG